MKNTSSPVALITGGAKRIGAAIARDLAANGFKIAIHYYNGHEEAQALGNELQQAGTTVEIFRDDLLASHGNGLIKAVCEKMGPPQLVINNASLFLDDSLDQLDPLIWDHHFCLHVKVPIVLASAMKQSLKNDMQGLIINMIDQRVLKPNPQFLSYTLSKSALWTATRTLAQALAPHIRVNAVGPGPSLKSTRQNEDDFKRQSEAILLGHGPDLAEFGATIRYLWNAKSVTGQMIALDGGQHLMWKTADLADIVE